MAEGIDKRIEHGAAVYCPTAQQKALISLNDHLKTLLVPIDESEQHIAGSLDWHVF